MDMADHPRVVSKRSYRRPLWRDIGVLLWLVFLDISAFCRAHSGAYAISLQHPCLTPNNCGPHSSGGDGAVLASCFNFTARTTQSIKCKHVIALSRKTSLIRSAALTLKCQPIKGARILRKRSDEDGINFCVDDGFDVKSNDKRYSSAPPDCCNHAAMKCFSRDSKSIAKRFMTFVNGNDISGKGVLPPFTYAPQYVSHFSPQCAKIMFTRTMENFQDIYKKSRLEHDCDLTSCDGMRRPSAQLSAQYTASISGVLKKTGTKGVSGNDAGKDGSFVEVSDEKNIGAEQGARSYWDVDWLLNEGPFSLLKTACRLLEISCKGKKADLLERLRNNPKTCRLRIERKREDGISMATDVLNDTSMSCERKRSNAISIQLCVRLLRSGEHNISGGAYEANQGESMQERRCNGGKAGTSDQNARSTSCRRATKAGKACRICNRKIGAKAKFCGHCGTSTAEETEETLQEFVENSFFPTREQEVSRHTFRIERGFWASILGAIGGMPVSQLNAAVWEEYIQTLKRRNCSARTQVLHQVAYQAAVRYAVLTNRLSSAHEFRRLRGCTQRSLKTVPLHTEEVYMLLAAASSSMHCTIFGVGIGMGLRPSELLRMRWEDVDFQAGTITIRGSKTAASGAAIPMTDLAKREIYRWWVEEDRPSQGLCFYAEGIRSPEKRSGAKKPIASFKKALLAAAQRAGIDETRDGQHRRIFPYILRHSFATLAATSNPPVPLPVAQAVMRHTSSKMLLETYAKAGALVIKEGLENFKV